MNPIASTASRRALRHTLAAVPLACAALFAAPEARAATVYDFPCGTHVSVLGEPDVKVVLHNCSYPSLQVQAGTAVIEGNGATIDLSGPAHRAVLEAVHGTLRDVRITGSTYGGLYLHSTNATIERVVIDGNSSPLQGGGIFATPRLVNLTLADSTIANNSAPVGGGLWFQFVDPVPSVTVKIVRSTISGNRAVVTPGDSGTGHAGGLWMLVSTSTTGRLELSHSTVSGNVADVHGGGMFLQGEMSASISDSTITGNSAGLSSDAILDGTGNVADAGMHVRRSIIAGNGSDSVDDCGFGYADFKQDYGYNVLTAGCVGALAAEPTTRVVASNGALLGALAANGGRTRTHLPMAGSPALDMIPPGSTGCTSGATDQRGFVRPQNGACDAGAVEVAVVAAFPWSGFVGPVNNPPTVNSMKAGAVAPVKFSLGGDRGLGVFAAGYPKSQFMACSSGAVDAVEETLTPGSSGLHYDVAGDTYTYAWKTDKAWGGRCATLLLRFVDGSERQAVFQFK